MEYMAHLQCLATSSEEAVGKWEKAFPGKESGNSVVIMSLREDNDENIKNRLLVDVDKLLPYNAATEVVKRITRR